MRKFIYFQSLGSCSRNTVSFVRSKTSCWVHWPKHLTWLSCSVSFLLRWSCPVRVKQSAAYDWYAPNLALVFIIIQFRILCPLTWSLIVRLLSKYTTDSNCDTQCSVRIPRMQTNRTARVNQEWRFHPSHQKFDGLLRKSDLIMNFTVRSRKRCLLSWSTVRMVHYGGICKGGKD